MKSKAIELLNEFQRRDQKDELNPPITNSDFKRAKNEIESLIIFRIFSMLIIWTQFIVILVLLFIFFT
jgi:hypothetical protein